MRAWDVEWGAAAADLVIENSYVDIAGARISRGLSTMDVDGRFSLGFPRKDRGEELNARVRMSARPVEDLKHAFELDDYQVDGALSGEFRVYGPYRGPFGFGRMQIDAGSSYGEAFDTASAALRFEGTGVRLDTLDVRKSTGSVTGAAFVGWDGTYSFNADARRVPVESLAVARFPSLPLTGLLDFSATGSGTFDEPRYSVRGRVVDLFAGEEGLGQLTGRIEVRGDEMSIAQLEGASPRLAVSGGGRITLSPMRDADLTLRFSRTSIDPYVRLLEPRLSPFTTVVASGGFRVVGPLRDSARLSAQGSIEDVDLRLFDYHLKNDGPIVLSLKDDVARIEKLRVVGDGTTLELVGEARLTEDRMRVRALGDANLSLLQGFFRDIRSSGSAKVQAEITGPTRGAGDHRQRRADRRPSPLLRPAALDRRRQRPGRVRRRRPAHRHAGGPDGRRRGPFRRPHRHPRRHARELQPHRRRPRHAHPLSGGLPLPGRHRPGAARPGRLRRSSPAPCS